MSTTAPAHGSDERCDHQFCPICIARVKREHALMAERFLSEEGWPITLTRANERTIIARNVCYMDFVDEERIEELLRLGKWTRLPRGYEIVDGKPQARHETGQHCDCEECTTDPDEPAYCETCLHFPCCCQEVEDWAAR